MRCSLLLGGLDRPYMRQLVRYMTSITRYSFQIIYLETIEECMAYDAMNLVHVIVVERTFLEAMPNDDCFGESPLMVLEEGLAECDATNYSMFKYQSASRIATMVYQCFLKQTQYESVQDQSRETRLVGCFSPAGGSGNTSIALMIAIAKSLQGKKVFYISLDVAMVYEEVFSSDQSYNLSDYSTYVMTHDNWVVGLECMKSVDVHTGIEYLKTPNHMQDLLDFQKDYSEEWLTRVKDLSHYDYVVIDFSGEDVLKQLACLRLCDTKVMVGRGDVIGLSKWSRFFMDLERSGEEWLSEVVKIGNPLGSGEVFANPSMSTADWQMRLVRDDALLKVTSNGWQINQTSEAFRQIEVLANGF